MIRDYISSHIIKKEEDLLLLLVTQGRGRLM